MVQLLVWAAMTLLLQIARRPVHPSEAEATQIGLDLSAEQPPPQSFLDALDDWGANVARGYATDGVEFFAAGTPAPQGSKRAFRNQHSGRIQMVESSKRTPEWRSDIRNAASAVMGNRQLLDGPLSAEMVFVFPRPRSHYGTGRNADVLKDSAPFWMSSAPDVSKLARGVEDAINAVVWTDDARIALYPRLEKHYGERPGVHVKVMRLT